MSLDHNKISKILGSTFSQLPSRPSITNPQATLKMVEDAKKPKKKGKKKK